MFCCKTVSKLDPKKNEIKYYELILGINKAIKSILKYEGCSKKAIEDLKTQRKNVLKK